MKKIVLVAIILMVSLFSILFLLRGPAPEEESVEIPTTEEAGTEEKVQTKETGETVDLSNRLSKDDRELIRAEGEDFFDQYLPAYFNFDKEPSKKNDIVLQQQGNDVFASLSDDNTISAYKSHTFGFFEIQDTEETIVRAGMIVQVHLSSDSIQEGDYDVVVLSTIQKGKEGWQVLEFIPSKILKANTGAFYQNETEGMTSVEGDYVADYPASVPDNSDEKVEKDSYGDYVEEDTTEEEEHVSVPLTQDDIDNIVVTFE